MSSPLLVRTSRLVIAALVVSAATVLGFQAPARADDPVTSTKVPLEAVGASSGSPAPNTTPDASGQRVLASAQASSGVQFTMLGLTWKAQQGGALSAQVRTFTGGEWTEWQTLEGSQDEVGGAGGTEPIQVGASTGYDVRVLGGSDSSVSGASVTLLNSTPRAADAQPAVVQPQASSSGVARPSFISRASWGADESLRGHNGADCKTPTIDTTINAVIVHHTAGTNTYTAAESASIVRGMYRFHVVDRGWCDLGYNVLVDKYGQTFEGRYGGLDVPVHGAHASSWNTTTLGISFMMNSSTMKQTEASVASAVKVIAWKLAGNYRGPKDTVTIAGKKINRISGHGDVMATECPGTNLRAYLPTLRDRVATAMGAWQNSPIRLRQQQLGGDGGVMGPVHILERPWADGRVTDFTGGTIWQLPNGATRYANARIAAKARSLGHATTGWIGSDQTSGGGHTRAWALFAKGRIYSTDQSVAWVTGPMLTVLTRTPALLTQLGYPVADARTSNGATSQEFERGVVTVYSDGTHSVSSSQPGDRNGDLRADLVMIDSSTQALMWAPTTSGLTAGTPQRIGGGWQDFTCLTQIDDINGDGFSDMVALRKDGTLWIYRSRGASSYPSPEQIGHGWGSMRNLVVMPDVTGNGLPELYAIDSDQNLVAFDFGPQGGYLVNKRVIGVNWGTIRLTATVGDFVGDASPDLLAVTTSGELRAYALNSQGRVTATHQVGHGWTSVTSVATPGDLNSDGRRDLLGRTTDGALNAYLNVGQTRWSSQGLFMDARLYRVLA